MIAWGYKSSIDSLFFVPKAVTPRICLDVVALGALFPSSIHMICLHSSVIQHLLQSLSSESRQDERSLVDVRVVVSAQLLLLLLGPRPQRHLDVGVGVLAAHHEADLARGIGWDGGVSVLGHREDLLAVLLELGDELQVKPLVLSCKDKLARSKCPIAGKRKGLREAGAQGAGKCGEGREWGRREGDGFGQAATTVMVVWDKEAIGWEVYRSE